MYTLNVEVEHNLKHVSDVLYYIEDYDVLITSLRIGSEGPTTGLNYWRYRIDLWVDVKPTDEYKLELKHLDLLEKKIKQIPGYIQLQSCTTNS